MEGPQHQHRNVKMGRCRRNYILFLNQRGFSWTARNRMVLVLSWVAGNLAVTAARSPGPPPRSGARRGALSPEACVSGAEGDPADGFAQPKTHASTPSHKESAVAVTDRKPSEIMPLSAYQFSCERVPPRGGRTQKLRVSTQGDDAGAGSRPSANFLTIRRAAGIAQAFRISSPAQTPYASLIKTGSLHARPKKRNSYRRSHS